MDTLTTEQVNQLARPFIGIRDQVIGYYKDSAHEAAYQAWYLKEFGCPAPDSITEEGR